MTASLLTPSAARFATTLLMGLVVSAGAAAATPGDVFRQWAANGWVERQITLDELGFEAPIVLQGDGSESRRELFLPVPASMDIRDATLHFDADYLRGDGGRSTLVVSLDGTPVLSRRYIDDSGSATQTIGVDGEPRPSGFVRLGLQWSSVISDVVCADQRAPGNVLRVQPTTRLRYRIDRNRLGSLATVWSTLPPRPVLLVSRKNLDAAAYDAAWRVGLALERAGKRVQVRALPAVGDDINLAGVDVPQDLRGVSAFGALAHGGMHRIANEAEVGALLALGSRGPVRADIAIADPALASVVNKALTAIAAQLGPDAPAFAGWRGTAFGLSDSPVGAGEVALRTLGGAPVLAVAADAGPQAALLFDGLWKPVAGAKSIALKTVSRPLPEDRILLSQLGGKPGSLDVGNRSDWTATFGIEDVSHDGRAPTAFVFDLASSPDSVGAAAVGSVYLNDYLLGAELLPADGKAFRLRVTVPSHILTPRNVVRVTFLRQLTKPRCHDQQTAYPVSVLPSSHVELGRVPSGNGFSGMTRRFADGAELLLPAAWLTDSVVTLPRTIRLTDAAGISLSGTTLVVVTTDKAAKPVDPSASFLALDLPVKTSVAEVDPEQGRLVLVKGKTTLLDASRLVGVGVMQVAESGGHHGIVYRATSADTAVPTRPVRLGRGDLALLDEGGVTLEVDTRDPRGAQLADEANPQSMWQRYRAWWIALGVLFVILALAARAVYVRRRIRRERASG